MENKGVNLKDVLKCSDSNDRPVLEFTEAHCQPGRLKVIYIVPRGHNSSSAEDEEQKKKIPKSIDLYEVRRELKKKHQMAPDCPLYRKFDAKFFLLIHFDPRCSKEVFTSLLKGFKVIEKEQIQLYRFFGHSPSQLRKGTCVFYNTAVNVGCDQKFEAIANTFGLFSSIKNVSKRAARIGLLLSTAKPVLELSDQEIGSVDDIENNGYNFTDGCGEMSLDVAQKVVENLSLKTYKTLNQKHKVPSVLQVRLKGCKGVLALNTGLDRGIRIRPSMEKFKWNSDGCPAPYPLGITDNGAAMSRPYTYASLNKQFVLLMSARGLPDKILIDKQKQYFVELNNLMKNRELQVRYLCAEGHYQLGERLLSGEEPDQDTEKILNEIILRPGKVKDYNDDNVLTRQARLKKDPPAKKLKIPLEKSRNVYGVCDQSGLLEYGTCFFQPTIKEGPQVLSDVQAVVAKNPSYHPGDIRVLRCVNIPQLRHLVDCLVFPTQGPRPHPDEIAGSDLDGDQYFVCWDQDLIPPNDVEPTSYEGQSAKPQDKITEEDLAKYFANYDRRKVGQLDHLFNKWADAKGINSKYCKLIASIFNIAIDSAKTGKVVPIPEFLWGDPPPSQVRHVWQMMFDSAVSYLQGKVLDAANKPQVGIDISYLDFEFVQDLVSNADSRASEFHMFRFIYKWCQDRENRAEYMTTLLQQINFARMRIDERRKAEIDLVEMGINGYKALSNTLYASQILHEKDIEMIKGDHDLSWVLYYQNLTDFRVPWSVINDVLQTETFKLLVFRLDMRGEEWVTAISFPQPLHLHDVVQVGTDDYPSSGKVFVCVHKRQVDCIKAGLSQKENKRKGEYFIALDGKRMQIYSNDRSQRTSTFVCLMDLTDESMGLSVDFTRFHESSFEQKHGKPKINRQYITGFEIYLCDADPMVSPALYNFRNTGFLLDKSEDKADDRQPDFVHSQGDFPQLGEKPVAKLSDAEKVESFIRKLKEAIESGNTTEAKNFIRETVTVMMKNEFLAFTTACKLETILWNGGKDPIDDLISSDTGLLILKVLIKYTQRVERLNRFCDTMKRYNLMLCPEDVTDFLLYVIFEAKNRKEVVNFLQNFMHAVHFLDEENFYPGADEYFIFWTSLMTVELITEVKEVETSFLHHRELYKAQILVEEEQQGKEMVLKTRLVIDGGKQPFKQEDAVMIYKEVNDVKSVYFAEILDLTGQVLNVNLVWPEESESSLKREVNEDEEFKWNLRVFPSLVSYRRTVQALQTVCVKKPDSESSGTSGPSDLILSLISSFTESSPDLSDRYIQDTVDQYDAKDLPTEPLRELLETSPPEQVETVENVSSGATVDGLNSNEPSENDAAVVAGNKDLEYFGHRVNRSQHGAIEAACTDKLSLIQGPPGTGKTYTAALIVRRWMEQPGEVENNKILVVAETNEAINNIVRKLLEVGVAEEILLRIGAPGKPTSPDLKCVSFEDKYRLTGKKSRGGKEFYDKEAALKLVKQAKVVCTTCMSAGRRFLQGFVFSRVLLDEAAQALEPSVLVPLSLGATRICLVGDDMQLPPFARCAQSFPQIEISLFQRMRGVGVPVHMLDTQYRMHREIAVFPSLTFYDSKLKTGVKDMDRIPPLGMPLNGQNLNFVNVENSRYTAVGTSKQNEEEVKAVAEILQKLLQKEETLGQKDIGVISPYKAQVRLLQETLKSRSLGDVDVRTVDGFQGQERQVIIVSSVVSDQNVGFLNKPNRMNVMLTRAKRGLIVIGHGATLRREKCDLWNQWMKHVMQNNLITDYRPPQPGNQSSESARGGAERGARRGGRGRGRARGGRGSSGQYRSGNHRDQAERPSSGSRGRGDHSRSGVGGDTSEGWIQVRRK